MKKVLKIIGIFFAVMFGIGLIGLALETPEQKAEREAKQETAKADNQKPEEKANEPIATPAEPMPAPKQDITEQANFGMTPKELGGAIDKKMADLMQVNTKLANVEVSSSSFMLDLGEGIFWTGNVDKQGMASASSYRTTLDGDSTKSIAFLAMAGITAQVLHPDLPKEQTAGEVAKLANKATEKAVQTKDTVTETMMIGDIKHYVEVYPTTNNIVIGAYHKDQ